MSISAVVLDEGRTFRDSSDAAESAGVIGTRIEVTMLGGFAVRVDGRSVASGLWSRRDHSALVKLLALSPGGSLHREQVMDALWPDLAVNDAAPRLHKAAHYARRALGHLDGMVLAADAVSLLPHADLQVDAERFRHLAEAALRDGGISSAEAAVAAYGGDLLPQDPYEPWVELTRTHLRRLYLEMLHQAEDWHRSLAAEPADEVAHLALARRYAARGDRVATLRQLDQLDHAMRRELGLEPSEPALELRRVVRRAVEHHPTAEESLSVVGESCLAADVDAPCCA